MEALSDVRRLDLLSAITNGLNALRGNVVEARALEEIGDLVTEHVEAAKRSAGLIAFPAARDERIRLIPIQIQLLQQELNNLLQQRNTGLRRQ